MRNILIITMILLSSYGYADTGLVGKWQLTGTNKILTFIDDTRYVGVNGKEGRWKQTGKDTMQIDSRRYRFDINEKTKMGTQLLHMILLTPSGEYNGKATYIRVEE